MTQTKFQNKLYWQYDLILFPFLAQNKYFFLKPTRN